MVIDKTIRRVCVSQLPSISECEVEVEGVFRSLIKIETLTEESVGLHFITGRMEFFNFEFVRIRQREPKHYLG